MPAARRNRIPIAPAARRIPSAPAAAQPTLPDEILEDIFLRLDDAADLARASAVCSSYRRVVSVHQFLRRFQSSHPPPLLGFLDANGFEGFFPVEAPHRSAPSGRALAQAADFTFSFLPDPYFWFLRDARDGRVLLLSQRIPVSNVFRDLVVCDPLHRQYVLIPPIPDGLVACVPQPRMKVLRSILAPAGKDGDGKEKDGEEGSAFRIVSTLRFENKFMAFLFSSRNQKWRSITHVSSRSLPDGCHGFTRYYAHGCVHWIIDSMCYSLMLDTPEMKFISFDLPPNGNGLKRAIVEAGENRLGLLILGDGSIDLFSKIWGNNGVGPEEWRFEKMIPLPKDCDGTNYHWSSLGASERYLPLLAGGRVCHDFPTPLLYFVLDLKTLLLERLCALTGSRVFTVYLYASFPPSLAPPSI